LLLALFTYSCKQFFNFDENLLNTKKMSGVWEVYEDSTQILNGTLIMYYNLENKDNENYAIYYRTSGVISYYWWWLHKKEKLYLLNDQSYTTYSYKIIKLKQNDCKLQREDGSFLKLKRKTY